MAQPRSSLQRYKANNGQGFFDFHLITIFSAYYSGIYIYGLKTINLVNYDIFKTHLGVTVPLKNKWKHSCIVATSQATYGDTS